MRKIIANRTHSPLPTRQHDWCAYYDGEEEAGNYGYGATEAEAIADFIENCQEDHDERLDPPVNLLAAVNQFRADTEATNRMLADIARIHVETTAMQTEMFGPRSLDSVREGSEHQMGVAAE